MCGTLWLKNSGGFSLAGDHGIQLRCEREHHLAVGAVKDVKLHEFSVLEIVRDAARSIGIHDKDI
jgi:hypothetical protein